MGRNGRLTHATNVHSNGRVILGKDWADNVPCQLGSRSQS